jgi:ribonuclease E
MTTRMLIDARHREETRVAVVKGNRIEEFDFESAERKQLKGNIYLAKVTRVEPSLQAAFVDYGGNRHGFLAFSEIHPDYYQIPKEDREALLREEAEHAAEEEALRAREQDDDDDDGETDEDSVERYEDDGGHETREELGEDTPRPEAMNASGSDDAVENLRQKRMNLRRRYKIQDVIRRRQVLLVQVVKEERGNKGAALTTYLSLAGRYCVLMPNTSHGGGISRKISNAADRKRLKTIMAELKLPRTMGCIVRTAGLQRTKVEIKRDFDYLARLWDGIRENTLKSAAPALIYGDSDLIKRAIRDIYNREIDDVVVEGEEGYRLAKDFMKLLMPSHAKRVQAYSDAVPLFQRFGVEDQLSQMYQPVVQLKSGGYLVINPTEALVSIDINSGRSTREHGIEQTAVATNLEAAHEIARQLRLRDMAGLVVIDFIDMENNSNVRKVEKAMKAALANDRARIQVGRISSFGLMEMSRQRLRTGVLEASTKVCPHCEGTGLVRTASSAGLSALRMLEDEAARGRGSQLMLRASQEAAFYVLNHKRAELAEIEERYGVRIEVVHDGEIEGARMSVESSGPPPAHAPRFAPPPIEIDDDIDDDIDDEEAEIEAEEAEMREQPRSREGGREGAREEGRGEGEGRGRRRRRRRGRRGHREDGSVDGQPRSAGDDGEQDGAEDSEDSVDSIETEARTGDAEAGEARRSRRGRRGGRRRRGGEGRADGETQVSEADGAEAIVDEPAEIEIEADAPVVAEEAPKKGRRRPRARKDEAAAEVTKAEVVVVEAEAEPQPEPVAEKPKRSRRKAAAPVEAAPVEAVAAPVAVEAEEAPAKPKRTRKPAAAKAALAAEAPSVEEVVGEAVPLTSPANDENESAETAAEPRRGWWQRTFGAE